MSKNISKLKNSLICVKITVYKGYHPDKVVYYRGEMPVNLVSKWRWYFEYLAARIKVKHPRMRVELTICKQTLLLGNEYVQEKIKNLLRHRKAKLQKLKSTPISKDLFDNNQIDLEKKIEQTKAEIESLERGEYHGWVPPYYINDIKKWI
nr:MAG TPA: hypothetical protein [Caudoviricetes sp.]